MIGIKALADTWQSKRWSDHASADRFRNSASVIDFGLSYLISEQGISAMSAASAIRSICGRRWMESRERKLSSFNEPALYGSK
jgi:hypothetical protein